MAQLEHEKIAVSDPASADHSHVGHRDVDDHDLADEDDVDTTPTYIRVEDLAAHGAHASEISKLLKVRRTSIILPELIRVARLFNDRPCG